MNLQDKEEFDIDASLRQAIGRDANRPEAPEEQLELLMGGTLRLSPHPDWNDWTIDAWDADPFSDRNWKFQLHTLRFLNPVRHLALEGDSRARSLWLDTARSWTKHNLDPENAMSTWAWSDMADGLRATQLALGARLVTTDSDKRWYRDALVEHRNWLADSANTVKRNHGMHQLQGLLVVSAVLNDAEGLDIAKNRLLELFDQTFDEEGVDDEGAPAYLLHNLRWWREVFRRFELESIPVPPEYSDSLVRTEQVIQQLRQPDGTLPQIGDTPRPTKVGAEYPIDGKPEAGLKPTLTLDAGYSVVRSDRLSSYTLIRHGSSSAGHNHDDKGSLLLFARGRQWFADPGFWNYNSSDPVRKYTKSRSSHNVATLVGVDSSGGSTAEVIQETATDNFYSIWMRDGTTYADHALYRQVSVLKKLGIWVVVDADVSASGAAIQQNWLLDTDLEVETSPTGAKASSSDDHLVLEWSLPAGGAQGFEIKTEPADIALRWKTKVPGTKVAVTMNSFGPSVMVATFNQNLRVGKWLIDGSDLVVPFSLQGEDYKFHIPWHNNLFGQGGSGSESLPEIKRYLRRKPVLVKAPDTPSDIEVVPFEELREWARTLRPGRVQRLLVHFPNADIPVNIKVSAQHSDRLLVTYNGSVDRSRSPHGVTFQRSRWLRDFDATTVQFADPTLLRDGELMEAWGQLSREQWAIEKYYEILREFRVGQSLPPAGKTIHFGSSAGGFQAIAAAAYDEGSTALANNPQLDWGRFYASRAQRVVDQVYRGENVEDVRGQYPWRVNLSSLFKRRRYSPNMQLLINFDSPTDYRDQLMNFLADIESDESVLPNKRVEIVLYRDKASGHNPLGKEETLRKISETFRRLESFHSEKESSYE